ncbi:MAG: lipopolysaccharide core biosynthesis protein [Firmicutes bacterium ADurb.Bin419]|nr:MAG: lipopolysaccharide core biosynthesis protein [Firmicutes bacterium ADurb.Bin419]
MVMKNILIIRLDEIGDLILSIPLIRELKSAFPEARITLVVKPALHNIFENCPYIDNLISFDASLSNRQFILYKLFPFLYFVLKNTVIYGRFDIAILPRFGIDTTQARKLAFLSMAARRIAFCQSMRSKHGRILVNECIDSPSLEHSVLKNLSILNYIKNMKYNDKLELWTTSEDTKFADSLSEQHSLKNSFTVVLALRSRKEMANWPLERYASLVSWLTSEYKCKILLVGGKEDRRYSSELCNICKAGDIVDLTGQTSLRQTFSIMRYCNLYIGNDTGPMHIAAAAGVPVLVICAHSPKDCSSSSFSRFYPWKVPYVVLQPESCIAPCATECVAEMPHCIMQISVEEVRKNAESMIRRIYES